MRFDELRTEFAKLIWANEPITSSDLVKIAQSRWGWSRGTTFTVLGRLVRMGVFQNQKGVVTSLIDKKDYFIVDVQKIIHNCFNNSISSCVASLASLEPIPDDEIDALQKNSG